MATTDIRKQDHKTEDQLPALRGPRLPYHPAIQERFGIDKASWKALVEAVFPNAVAVESVILALSYCRARKLDPFKRNVHIVPIWNKELGRMVDTIWPGIGELRTTAFRTGEYAGRGQTAYGPDITKRVGREEVTFPEWAQVTVYRMVKGQKVEFCGPRVYWLETYATAKRNDDTPNEMWLTRPRGQIEKCAEAAALRAAFPEELGGDYIPEEVQHSQVGKDNVVEGKATNSLDELAARLEAPYDPAATAHAPNDDEAERTSETDALDDSQESEPLDYDAPYVNIQSIGVVNEKEAEIDALDDPTIDRQKNKEAAERRREAIRASRGERSNAK